LEFLPTPLAGLTVVRRTRVEDNRGFLDRIYSVADFDALGVRKPVAQINHTLTRRVGAVRGMHFQRPPYAETKLVSCLRGEVFDVAVDLRRHSPTFLRWHAEVLSAANQRSLLIPEGFAHGFQALAAGCELVYVHTASYMPDAEGAVNVRDPELKIAWPLAISELSERDSSHLFLTAEFKGIDL
jgi:dTDP-4-dehydrorhamnose 3,5-epimerase